MRRKALRFSALHFFLINSQAPYIPSRNDGLDLIYRDESLIVVNKPAGLLAVPGRGVDKQDCLASRVQAHDASTDTSRVELEPVTGHTHQLRVHMAAIGHPIMGDALYGGEAEGRAERLLLHASALSFAHPLTAKLLNFASEPSF